ncbi:AAA family ATPase [Brucella intermedia]|uniref:AAA family ATPase n=1 Tax=Brucella ciceri TaxID=391287 RepID=A0ABX1DWK2_9HYPH|nr:MULTISPECIES: AAA family ATPase [Brucella/Ochrobactrum group]NKC27953.1 AAA family ATPase [Brucella ciceri]PJT20626.1 shikimate kinase [Ochrobactrum sp. 30A/1000/2015]PJT40049.1 shikimate kinase [Ochrobactrum sp. 27A/999/2015]PJT43387.1 shikimate kinase [Ochrobactrum sp. 23A/997/2015]KAB2706672.1 AAA family ATPase [Brucella intermedia]
MEHSGEILILTGTPGAGKTTTAERLANQPGSPKVHLHSDDFWHFIKNGAIQPYLPEAHAQNVIVMDALTKAAKAYADGGYFVIVDGIIGPWFLEPFRNLATPLHYVVLRPSLDEAIRRCRERGGNTLADPGPIAELHGQLSALGPLEPHVLAAEGWSRSQTLAAVRAAVESGAFRLHP